MRDSNIDNEDQLAEEQGWITLLATDDERGLELIFNKYYKYLVVTAYNYLKDDEAAKDLVQDVFFRFWEKRSTISIDTSLKAFLRRSVVNKSIDEIRKKRIRWDEEITDANAPVERSNIQRVLETSELQSIIDKAIDSLPERCRVDFSLSRLEQKSHKEIAEALGISTKTIENQITKALKVIRSAVDKYSTVIVGLLMTLKKLIE